MGIHRAGGFDTACTTVETHLRELLRVNWTITHTLCRARYADLTSTGRLSAAGESSSVMHHVHKADFQSRTLAKPVR